LNAAGYTPEEIATIPKQEAIPFTPREGDTLTEYTPTVREDIRGTVADTAESLGASKGYAYQLGEGVAGSDDQMGLLDITPVGIAMGLQEGTRQFQRGYNSGSKTDMAMGAVNAGLNVVEAIPGAALFTKGLGKVVKGAGSRISKVFSASSKPDIAFQKAILDDTEFEPLDEVTLFPVSKPYVPPANFSSDITLTPEEGLASIKSYVLDDVKNYDPTGMIGELAQNKKKILDSFKDEELFSIAQELPHHNDPKYGDFMENNIKPAVKYLGVPLGDFLSLINEVGAYYPPKKDTRLLSLTETNLPEKAPIGPRAGTGPERPSDKSAEALGFKDTVYHTSTSEKEFTKFDLSKSNESVQDMLGVHVGTARAAAERNLYVTDELPTGSFGGKTMELRARTDTPLTKEEAARIFNKNPEDIFDEPSGPFSEGDVNSLIREYQDSLFSRDAPLPKDAKKISVINFRRELAKEGFTHIPYINDIEDPGSTSLIMLIDRPKDSPAVLRDVRAQFDPEKATNPGLRFAEGGMVEDKQMNELMQEGGMADDGMSQEPVTGNDIPPGALASEVRDDVDAKLSEGEYIISADVVRYFGVSFFEDLRAKAKEGLADMEANGRIGGAAVDAQGVPLEDSMDDLSPEEEQMLQQALGSTGMAEGGDVVGFDRTKFNLTPSAPSSLTTSSNIETRQYFNPSTGEKQSIQFMDGIAISAIPAGFVPWSQTLEDTYNSTGPRKSSGSSSSDDMMTPTTSAGGGSGLFNYAKWADKNYDAINGNPYEFGMKALDDTSGNLGAKGLSILGLASGIFPLAAAGGVLSASNKLQNIAEANAALKIMESRGLVESPEYKSLATKINAYVEDLPALQQGLVANKVAATANQYTKALEAKAGTAPVSTTATPSANPAPAKAPAATKTATRVAVPNATPTSLAPATSPRPVTRPTSTAAAATPAPTKIVSTPAGNKTVTIPKPTVTPQGGRFGFEDGGLVTKPKKTTPKSKGLGGKQ
jgi:hypothetical protein